VYRQNTRTVILHLNSRGRRGRDRMVVWISNHLLCNQCLLPLMLWVRISFMQGVLVTTLCDKVWQWLAAGP